jgi:hypothetical protein
VMNKLLWFFWNPPQDQLVMRIHANNELTIVCTLWPIFGGLVIIMQNFLSSTENRALQTIFGLPAFAC